MNAANNIADNAVRVAIDSGDWGCVEVLIGMGAVVEEEDVTYAERKFPDNKCLIAGLRRTYLGRTLSCQGKQKQVKI
ncbi:hypothetical protein DLREEDagrD3_13390 [Denitratisoma sp. agr-D3]